MSLYMSRFPHPIRLLQATHRAVHVPCHTHRKPRAQAAASPPSPSPFNPTNLQISPLIVASMNRVPHTLRALALSWWLHRLPVCSKEACSNRMLSPLRSLAG